MCRHNFLGCRSEPMGKGWDACGKRYAMLLWCNRCNTAPWSGFQAVHIPDLCKQQNLRGGEASSTPDRSNDATAAAALPGAAAAIDSRRKLMSYMSAALLALVPWMQVSDMSNGSARQWSEVCPHVLLLQTNRPRTNAAQIQITHQCCSHHFQHLRLLHEVHNWYVPSLT